MLKRDELAKIAGIRFKIGEMLAYFDTNIFDNILKRTGGVTEEDEVQLRVAIETGQMSILPGVLNLQETVGAFHSRRPDIVLPQLELILSLCDWERFVKPHNMILEDDVRHFAWNGEPTVPFVRESTARQLRSMTKRLIDGSEDMHRLDAEILKDQEQKKAFLDRVQEVAESVSQQTQELHEKGEIPDFEQYFHEGVTDFAVMFAKSHGVADGCVQHGIQNLVKIRSIRAFLGFSMSLIYRRVVEQKKPKIGAARDLQHVPSAASAADVFVTHDEELRLLLGRVPIRGFRVATLEELLAEISPKLELTSRRD
jgi:hypothetical protein